MKYLSIKKHCFVAMLFFTFFSSIAIGQPSGYNYGKQLLVNASQVSGTTDLTNFVMLVNFIDSDLSTATGHVTNTNGYDIVFTLGDCNTLLEHQIEKYVPSTGEYIAWVKIPTLFATTNTNIHMYYGNSSVSTDPSTTNIWDANHAAVYHMNQSPAGTSPQLIDYTANTNDGAANGSMVAADLVAGKIGSAIDFDGSNDYFDCGADASTDPSGSLTVSAWIYSRSASGHIINRGGGWSDPGYSLFHLSNNIRIELQRSGEKDIVDNSISINTWHYVALTYNSTSKTIRCYIDGVQQGNTGNHTGPIGTPVENLNIGRKQKNGYYFNGIIDEGRVIFAQRNSAWLTTEYNNQNSPSTFYTKSAEYSASNLCWTLPIQLIDFSAKAINMNDAIITWTTKSEVNNDYFTLQKSTDIENWITISTIEGAGNSTHKIDYSFIDRNISDKTIYYRLKQTDFDGSYTISDPISVQSNNNAEQQLFFPNPASSIIYIHAITSDFIKLFNIAGELVFEIKPMSTQKTEIDISNLSPGTYFIQIGNKTEKLIKH